MWPGGGMMVESTLPARVSNQSLALATLSVRPRVSASACPVHQHVLSEKCIVHDHHRYRAHPSVITSIASHTCPSASSPHPSQPAKPSYAHLRTPAHSSSARPYSPDCQSRKTIPTSAQTQTHPPPPPKPNRKFTAPTIPIPIQGLTHPSITHPTISLMTPFP